MRKRSHQYLFYQERMVVLLKEEMIDILCVMVDEAVILSTYHLKYHVNTYLAC